MPYVGVFFTFCTSSPAHHLRPDLSTALNPQSLPSASPRTPRRYVRRHRGRVSCRRAIWRNSVPQRDVRWFQWRSWCRTCASAHVGLGVGHPRLFRHGRVSFLPRLWSVLLRRCFAGAMVDVGSDGALHVTGNVSVDIQRDEAIFLHWGRESPHSSLLYFNSTSTMVGSRMILRMEFSVSSTLVTWQECS